MLVVLVTAEGFATGVTVLCEMKVVNHTTKWLVAREKTGKA